MPFTLVVFHAHPDDEALLTAGTMARASAEGHRVVLVTATDGGVGLVASDFLGAGESLADRRAVELRRSATALGCARTVRLGYADSGLDGSAGPGSGTGAPGAGEPEPEPEPDDRTPEPGHRALGEPPTGRGSFALADVGDAAAELAGILREERADVLTVYDPAGGYGHPDHVQVHDVGVRAAELAGTPSVLEATVDRDLLLRAIELAGSVYRFPPEFDRGVFETAYTPANAISHRINVRDFAIRKRTSMLAHASQATADGADRTLAAFLRLPIPLFRLVFGTEWFVDVHRSSGPQRDDIFSAVR